MEKKAAQYGNSENLIMDYLSEVRQIDLLDDEQFLYYIKQAKQGDQQAIRTLIEANLRLVISIAKRFKTQSMPLIDLIQEGNLGLMRSIAKFDETLGYKFSTFASWWIKQEIIRSLENKGRLIRLPVNVAKALKRIKRVCQELIQQGQTEIKTTDIAVKAKLAPKKVKEFLKLEEDVVSLETITHFGSEKFLAGDAFQPEKCSMEKRKKDFINYSIEQLDTKEQTVMNLRYGLDMNKPHTHAAIAEILGVSRERVRQMEKNALKKIKETIEKQEATDLLVG